jgi:hypothetical protein
VGKVGATKVGGAVAETAARKAVALEVVIVVAATAVMDKATAAAVAKRAGMVARAAPSAGRGGPAATVAGADAVKRAAEEGSVMEATAAAAGGVAAV